ncbi:hypothetical protein VP01_2474g2 [Puccinia sorghi]|uniref:Uncharacterized protein n=1 Tax=Puccinia sorghi TaxID=27349 RepID=A0A0L6V646_9BASI|nr:hypothetical protein VP01_2474g2 [Puccinia sorghi]
MTILAPAPPISPKLYSCLMAPTAPPAFRWRGDNKGGATKSTLAAGILAEMVDAGITHRDTKGIQTKIQELQASYTKASNFLRGTGAGILDEDVQDGSMTLSGMSFHSIYLHILADHPFAFSAATLMKMCRYWDVLYPIMGAQTCTNPDKRVNESSCHHASDRLKQHNFPGKMTIEQHLTQQDGKGSQIGQHSLTTLTCGNMDDRSTPFDGSTTQEHLHIPRTQDLSQL